LNKYCHLILLKLHFLKHQNKTDAENFLKNPSVGLFAMHIFKEIGAFSLTIIQKECRMEKESKFVLKQLLHNTCYVVIFYLLSSP